MVCEKNKCTGCFACYNICPKNAILMEENSNGFIYPKIDEEKCIKCGLCKKVCPSINALEKKYPLKCYAAISKKDNIRKNSTSGGIATTISNIIIDNGGIVYGAAFISECNVEHVRVESKKDVEKLQGSKYVHSYINETYKKVKEDLKTNKVLFIGTPCQIAGLKKYLNKEYENLILIDIICHGVPSQKYLKEEVKRLIGDINIDRIYFRNGNQYGLYPSKNNKIINGQDIGESPYSDAFMNGLTLRENCFNCLYAGSKRVSDITIGDFWGLSVDSKFYAEKEKGVSVILINNLKGEKFFNEIQDNFNIEERSTEEAIKGNSQLMHPAPKNRNYIKFQELYPKYGFEESYKKTTKLVRAKRKIKKILKRMLKHGK